MNLTTLTQLTNLEFAEFGKNWYQTYTAAGLKVEIKTSKKNLTVIVGYNLASDDLPAMYQMLDEPWELTKTFIRAKNVQPGEVTAFIAEADQVMADNAFAVKGSRRKRQTADDGYFEGAAKVIKAAVDAGFWHILDRGALGFDAHDKLITIGKSAAVTTNPSAPQWREHIVPCMMIIEEAVRLFEEGEAIATVAQMLKTNLAIVVITAEEAKRLDAVYQTTMPEGWEFGDSVTARLDVMGIAY